MRAAVAAWVSGLVLSLAVLVPYAPARIIDGIVAVVNGEPVTFSEVRDVAAESMGIPAGDADLLLREERDPARVLRWVELLVEGILVRQELEILDQPVRNEEVDRAVESIRRGNNLTEEQFRAALAAENLTLEGYRRRIRWQMERAAIVRARKFREVTVTEEEVRAFFRENAERFLEGAEVRIESLHIPVPDDMGDEHDVRLRVAAQQAQEIVRQGLPLAEAAALLEAFIPGVSVLSSGFIRTQDFHPDLEREVRRLRSGEVSPPFFTEAGGHMIKVLERRGGTLPKFSSVKDVVAEELTDRRSEQAYADILAELKREAAIDVRF
jgi:peptidyl-prolyl cis-trans isomerase SurA